MSASIYLVKGREKSLLRRHPWIFSKGIERVQGNPVDGDTVEIFTHDGKWLARGAWSGSSQIRARVWTFDKDESVDLDFFIRRLKYAQESRDGLIKRQGLTGYRLCAAESDGLPGLTIDRYADFLVCQILSAGAEFQRELITQALRTLYPECSIYERSDVAVRKKEGLKERRVHGKDHLLDDPNQQRFMLASRSISGTYEFKDGSKKTYTGQEELALLKFLDDALNWPGNDVHCPAPQNFEYTDQDGRKRWYIPDVYIESVNLIVEVKGEMHNGYRSRDIEIERAKDAVLETSGYVYVKTEDRNYGDLMDALAHAKAQAEAEDARHR
jgi:hypothetical protein